MASVESDSIADALLLLDFLPSAIVEVDHPGSPLQRWIEGGNGLVWTGNTPFLVTLDDDGISGLTALAAEAFFGSPTSGVVQGRGLQTATELGESVLPSLVPYRALRALRYDNLGSEWSVARVFSEDGDSDSDAIELVHSSRGFYAQFLCADDGDLPRPAVLVEYLRERIGTRRNNGPLAGARR